MAGKKQYAIRPYSGSALDSYTDRATVLFTDVSISSLTKRENITSVCGLAKPPPAPSITPHGAARKT